MIVKAVKFLKILFILFFLLAIPASAAEFYFGAPAEEVGLGQTVEVGVFLNTEGETINALEGTVQIPQEHFAFKEIRDGSTIVSMWINNPRMETNAETNQHEVVFSGIIPGGYMGSRGYLFSVILEARAEGATVLDTTGVQVLRHDGLGTPTAVRSAPARFTIVPVSEGAGFLPPYDADPPETFVPEIAQDPNVAEGKWFVVFSTQDKGAGIDHYVIHESRRMKKRIATRQWSTAESPYVLQDQKLHSFVYVKAVDKAGNARIAILEPRYPWPLYARPGIWSILGVIFIALYAWWRIVWRKIKVIRE